MRDTIMGFELPSVVADKFVYCLSWRGTAAYVLENEYRPYTSPSLVHVGIRSFG
jgi:hypothetical protein